MIKNIVKYGISTANAVEIKNSNKKRLVLTAQDGGTFSYGEQSLANICATSYDVAHKIQNYLNENLDSLNNTLKKEGIISEASEGASKIVVVKITTTIEDL